MQKKYLIITFSFFFTIVFVFSLMSWASSINTSEQEETTRVDVPPPEPTPEIPQKTLTYTVKKGDVLGKILPQFDLNTHEVHTAAKDIFDLNFSKSRCIIFPKLVHARIRRVPTLCILCSPS